MIKIDSIHFTADQKLINFIENKYKKIQSRYPEIVSITVKLSLENNGQIKDKIVESIVKIPRHTFVGKGLNKSFEKAAQESLENIQRQLKKFRTRIRQQSR